MNNTTYLVSMAYFSETDSKEITKFLSAMSRIARQIDQALQDGPVLPDLAWFAGTRLFAGLQLLHL